uniref:filament-like plant protein 4 n=1 Tax=Erigeron canadensis TaxID=72917 RepID=UPI001CB9D78F|nr:filament-like plant protein 4 [Erigeron canadensis]XP_043630532.1 filament-like plant protein 4 [Erigeron canadensis]XP_043630539.1 filament-like plant protein 4 [Erigeron canadensis]XP_043630545.1 filament-like plant protein 4 [Erigeron canadensis]
MDRRSWPWKKKSSDKSGADKTLIESVSVHASAGSQGDKVKQDSYKKPNYVQISVDQYSHLTGLEDQVKSYEDQLKSYDDQVKSFEDQVKSYDEQVKRYEDQQLVYEDQIKTLEDEVKDLNEQLSEAHSEMTTKENMVKQHAKVAEEAVSGWEKAEAEAATLKNHLESVTLLKLTAEDRASHLDGALKECMRQIRNLKEEHEQNVHNVVLAKTKQFDRMKHEFDAKIANLDQELMRSAAENAAVSRSLQDRSNMLIKMSEEKAQAEAEIELLKSNIDSCEREINSLKYELHLVAKELEIRNEEKNMSLRSAEVANKQHAEGVKKIAKLEAECQRLRGLVRKKLPGPAALAQMKLEVDSLGRDYGETRFKRSPVKPPSPQSPHFSSLPDFSLDSIQKYQKENELLTERLLATEEETKMLKEALAKRNTELQASRNICAKTVSKLQNLESQLQSNSQVKTAISQNASNPPSVASFSEEGNDDDVSVAGSWATAMISELSHNKKDKTIESPQRSDSTSRLELMDDFLEMEKLANSSNGSQVATDSELQGKEKLDADPLEKPNGGENLNSKITELLNSLPKDTDSDKLYHEISRVVRVCGSDATSDHHDQELAAAISRIYDFVLILGKEAKSVVGTSLEENEILQKVEEFSVSFKEIESSKINLNDFVLGVSGVVSKASELRFSFVGDEANDNEASSPDCIDKVALPENKVDYSNGCSQFSDTTSDPDIPHDGSSVPTSDLNVKSWKCSLEEFEQIKLEKENMVMDLARCNENLEATKIQLTETELHLSEVKSQLTAAQKLNGLSETQLKCMAESYNSLEVRAGDLQSRVNLLESKIEMLDNELAEERKNHEDTEAKCKDLQEQLQRLEASPVADMDIKSNQEKELAAAAEKLAECQETIFLLGKQLNGMRPQSDFMGSPLSQKGQSFVEEEVEQEDEKEEITTSSGMNMQPGNESPVHLDNHQYSPSDSEANNLLRSPISSKTSKHRPTKSGSSSSSSNPTPEKNTRGFSRFFSTKAK